MVDEAERGVFKQYEAKFSAALKEDPPDHLAAFAHFDEMLNGDRYPYVLELSVCVSASIQLHSISQRRAYMF